jgi:MFS family permease
LPESDVKDYFRSMSFTSDRSCWHDVYLVAGSRATSVCGDFLAATTLALVLQQAGHGGLAVSGLLLAASLPLALLAPITGRIADRLDSRTILVVTGLAQAVICLALAFATSSVAIIALVAALACGLAVTQPTYSALLPQMVRAQDLPKASGLSQTAGAIGMLVAPALAGVLVGQSGSRLPLLIDAASYLALVVAGLLIHTRRRGAEQKTVETQPWRVRDDRSLTVIIGALAAVVAGVGAVNVFEVFFIRDTLGASTTMFGLVAGSWTVGMLFGGAVTAKMPNRLITAPTLLGLMAGSCAMVLAAAGAGSAGWMIPLWIAGGVCNGGINVFVTVLVAGRAPAESRGRAFAAIGAAVQGAGMLGLIVAGPLVDHFEPRPLVAAAGIAGLLAALACLPMVRREPVTPRMAAESPNSGIRTPVAAQR